MSEFTTAVEWVEDAIGVLLAGYPNQTRSWAPEQHRDYRRAVAPVISAHNQQVVSAAVSRLHRTMPQWLPTVGQVAEVVAYCQREWERAHPLPVAPVGRQLAAAFAPREDSAQAEYVQAGGNDYEKLTRLWECESQTLELDPNKPSPRDVAARRLRQLEKIMDRPGNAVGPLAADVERLVGG